MNWSVCSNSECGHTLEEHSDLGACTAEDCSCGGFEQGGGDEEPGTWLNQPDWKNK